MGAWLTWGSSVLLAQRGFLFPWAPVALSLGIGAYFALRVEPGVPLYGGLGLLGAGAVAGAALRPGGWSAMARIK